VYGAFVTKSCPADDALCMVFAKISIQKWYDSWCVVGWRWDSFGGIPKNIIFLVIHPFPFNFAEKFTRFVGPFFGKVGFTSAQDSRWAFVKMALAMLLSFKKCESVENLGAYSTGD